MSEREQIVSEVLALLRKRAESRERQAEVLDERKGLPVTISMAEVVRTKYLEVLACIADVERWMK